MATSDTRPHSPVTVRALLLGLALIPLNAYWVILAEMRWYQILTLNPLFVTPVFFLLVLILFNRLLALVSPQAVLSVGELLTVYVMLAVSCTVATHDFGINLMSSLGFGAWFATPENKWEDNILPFMPRWAYVWDKTVLRGLFDGGGDLYQSHVLLTWLGPVSIWVAFMLVMFGTMLCLNVLVRKAWIEETKLSFPVVRLPLAMVGADTPGLYRAGMLWLGMLFPLLNGTLSGLNKLYPRVPFANTRAVFPSFRTPPWNGLGAPRSFYPFAIGLGYFVPLDVLFSCWFFYLFIKAQMVAGHYAGLRLPGYPYVMEQGIGAWTTYGVLLLYITRSHWQRTFAALWDHSDLRDEGELLPRRVAFWGALAGITALVVFWRVAGMTLFPAVLVVGTYFLLALSITRVRAEAGSQHTVWDLEPSNLFRLVDSRLLGRGNIIGAGMSHWFWRLNRSHAMPTQLEALKIWHDVGLSPRSLLLPLALATVASCLAGPWAFLQVGYDQGLATRCVGFARWTGLEMFGSMNSMLVAGHGFEWPRLAAVVLSSLFTLLLWVQQSRCAWLWLHPLGYCAGPGMIWVWCPFLIAWLLKWAIVRYGGQRAYRQAIPFFLGLVLGDYFIGSVWAVLSPILNIQGYQIFH